MSDKIFIIGASGDIGSKLTRFLLKKNADVTLYVRDVEKTKNLFAQDSDNLKIVQGDYTTTDVFEKEIAGHNRLFILVSAAGNMPKIKGTFARIAYAAGVRQILDISSYTVNFPYRSNFINTIHHEGEVAILAEKKDDTFYVALRPGRFYSSQVWLNANAIKTRQSLDVIHDLDYPEDFVSTTDIAEMASVVLTEPIEKHANCVYTMISETLSANERAAIFSEAIGKPVKGNVIPIKAMYDHIISVGFPHFMAINLVQKNKATGATPYFSIMIGRPAQSLREWLQEDNNAAKFQ
ncbi:NAD(P)-binding protein [Backusella circina FSU 941]|nr:NAD(P)-binding protein [Backusella circina FSU 941]